MKTAKTARDESGVIIVWTTLMLVVFLGVTAFAVDIAYWHLEKGRQQRAADAAALAGAINWPGDSSNSNAAALDVAGRNGYSAAAINQIASTATCDLTSSQTTVICAGPGQQPYQYKVTVARKVRNIFGGIFGIDETVVRASATAEYLKPLSMGSPSNQFGNDPDNTTWPINANSPPQTYPNFWANIAGGNSTKTNGDAYAADTCNTSTDGCTGDGTSKNLNYVANGYYYTVDFTGSGTVNLQAFDPAFTNVGDYCTDGSTNLTAAAALANVPGYPQGATNTADISKRYAPVTNQNNQQDPGYQYCSGDIIFGSGPPPTTTYTVLKAVVPGQPSTATQVCQKSYPGSTGDVSPMLALGGTVPGASEQLAKYFRQWNTICQVSGDAGDEYFIQISTDHGSAGHNRFALRATTSAGTAASQVTVAGNTYMGIYANVGGGQTSQFHLARVPTAAAGHTLVLNFFDIGDAAADPSNQLQVVPPVDSNVGSTFGNCKWTGFGNDAIGYGNNTWTAPWGQLRDITDCKVTGVNSGGTWNGQWSTVTIPIPSNYTCNDADRLGCWLKINYRFASNINDTTSWNAYLLGDPVRLTH